MFNIFNSKSPLNPPLESIVREVDGYRVKIQLTFINKIGETEVYTEFIEGDGSPESIVEEYCFNAHFTRSLMLYNDKIVINNPQEQLQKAKILDSKPIKVKKTFYEPLVE